MKISTVYPETIALQEIILKRKKLTLAEHIASG